MSEESTKTVRHILEDSFGMVNEANGALSRLWRLILLKLEFNEFKWERSINQYCIDDTKIRGKRDASLKGNLEKTLATPDMTWKVFCRGLSILNFREVKLCIILEEGEKSTSCSVVIPKVFRENTGYILSYIWGKLLDDWPDRQENWKEYFNDYCDWFCNIVARGDSGDLKGNLSRTLGSDSLTWATFFKGLSAMNVDNIYLRIELQSRKSTECITLTMPNGRKNIDVKNTS